MTLQTLPVECIYEGVYLHLLLKGEILERHSVLRGRQTSSIYTYWKFERSMSYIQTVRRPVWLEMWTSNDSMSTEGIL